MSSVVNDIQKHVTTPVGKFVNRNQKRIRIKAIKILEEPSRSLSPGRNHQHSNNNNTGGGGNSGGGGSNSDNNNNNKNGEHGGGGGVSSDDADINFVLSEIRSWDVTMPPVKKYKMGGRMIPSVKNTMNKVILGKLLNKKRRITIELYKKATTVSSEQQATINENGEERERRIFSRLYSKASISNVMSTMEDEDLPPLDDEDYIIFRILKQVKQKGDSTSMFDFNDDDDDSQSTASHHLPNGSLDAHSLTTYNITDYGDGHDEAEFIFRWKERYRTRLSCMEIQNVHTRMIEIQLGIGDDVILRDFCFDNPHEVETFIKVFEKMSELQHERGSRLAMNHQQTTQNGYNNMNMNMTNHYKSRGGVLGTTPENEPIGDDNGSGQKNQRAPTIINHRTGSFGGLFSSKKENKPLPNYVNLLIEIVSATNLPIADLTSSDPYVCVEDGRTEWHRTGVISKSLNPVWTLSTGSLFLIQTTLNDFFEGTNRIEFIIKDHDTVGENDILGSVLVNKNELLAGEGERIDYKIRTTQCKGKSHVFVGNKKVRSLYICFVAINIIRRQPGEIRIPVSSLNVLFYFILFYFPFLQMRNTDIPNISHILRYGLKLPQKMKLSLCTRSKLRRVVVC
jgi:hypothetical protein